MSLMQNEKVVDLKQINNVFTTSETEKSGISKGVLATLTPFQEQKKIQKKTNLFIPCLLVIFLYTSALIFITIRIYKTRNERQIDQKYKERTEIIEKEVEKVFCNLFFSCLGAVREAGVNANKTIIAGLSTRANNLNYYFFKFIEKYFDIYDPKLTEKNKQNIDAKIKEIYCLDPEAKNLVTDFFTKRIPDIKKQLEASKNKHYREFSKQTIMEVLLPAPDNLNHDNIEYFLPLDSYSIHMDYFPVAKRIAERLTKISVYCDVDFQKKLNKSEGFLFFLQSIVEMDWVAAKKIMDHVEEK